MKSGLRKGILADMEVRSAKTTDVERICELINEYAEQDKMLHRSMADVYERLQTFLVCTGNRRIVGCCSLEVVWSDLAEIKSLAVDIAQIGRGVGRDLVATALERARQLGVRRVFALTLEPGFFTTLGFTFVDKETLPMKVWSDCAACPKQEHCDEIAVIKDVD